MVSLYTVQYNFIRIHKSLRVTPAMEAGRTDTLHDPDIDWLVDKIDATASKPLATEEPNNTTNGPARPLGLSVLGT